MKTCWGGFHLTPRACDSRPGMAPPTAPTPQPDGQLVAGLPRNDSMFSGVAGTCRSLPAPNPCLPSSRAYPGLLVFMRRFFPALIALLVVLGAMGAELRLVETPAMLCCCGGSGHQSCGMPQRSPHPCGNSIPAPVAAPSRTVAIVVEAVTTAQQRVKEPRPWSATWVWVTDFGPEASALGPVLPVDTGPPPLASERRAQLGVFRI